MSRSEHRGAAAAAETIARAEAAATVRTTAMGPPDRRVAWRLWGEERLPALVLLHGDFGSWTHWIRCIAPLARRCRVVVPDMPGYGDSGALSEPWGPEDMAGALAAGLAQLLPPRAYRLAGFSFGGIVAGHLAATEGERVEALALLGPGGLGLPRPALPPLRRPDRGMAPGEVLMVHRHNLAALMLADPERADALALHVQSENARRARARAGDIPAGDALLRALPRLRAPRLLGLWGERDVWAQPVHAREEVLRRLRPDVDFRTIPGAGHWTPYEAPGAVVTALLDLLPAQ
jgi:pimeloyl-ACP methyl ester carboxylesterase